MNRIHAVLGLMALAVTMAFGGWSFAQQPEPDPEPVGPFEQEIDIDSDVDFDFDMDRADPGGFPGPRGRMGGAMLAGLAEELGLTEEQQTRLRALRFEQAKGGLQTRTNVLLRRIELEELLQQDEPNPAELNKRIQALADAQGAALRQRIEHRMAFRRILTPEQRARLRTALRQRLHHRLMMRREGGRMHGPQVERFQRFERREAPRPPQPPDL
jgi:Spy/CpxP family protein refolding chaperone